MSTESARTAGHIMLTAVFAAAIGISVFREELEAVYGREEVFAFYLTGVFSARLPLALWMACWSE